MLVGCGLLLLLRVFVLLLFVVLICFVCYWSLLFVGGFVLLGLGLLGLIVFVLVVFGCGCWFGLGCCVAWYNVGLHYIVGGLILFCCWFTALGGWLGVCFWLGFTVIFCFDVVVVCRWF